MGGEGTTIFHFIGLVCQIMLESLESMTLSANIACPAVGTSDVTNKAGVCGRSIKYVTVFTGKERFSTSATFVCRNMYR